MPIIDDSLSTLQQIIIKVRRLTRSPSDTQLSENTIKDYINTFVLYDFPQHLRLMALKTNFTFYCAPNVDVYENNTTDPTSPLYNFKNKYISINPPFYVAGFQVAYFQSEELFKGVFPYNTNISQINQGNGVTTNYSGTLSASPILRNNVTFTSIGANNSPLVLIDTPYNGQLGFISAPGAALPVVPAVNNQINYVTGAYNITFTSAPANTVQVMSQTVPVITTRPQAILFYNNKFTLRPVPDQPYRIDMEAYIRPTELLAIGTSPEIAGWAQYIAYGASKKIFEDRMDMDSIEMIMPEFKNQEALIQRPTHMQIATQRAFTMFSDNQGGYGVGFGGNGWSNW